MGVAGVNIHGRASSSKKSSVLYEKLLWCVCSFPVNPGKLPYKIAEAGMATSFDDYSCSIICVLMRGKRRECSIHAAQRDKELGSSTLPNVICLKRDCR